MKRYQVALVAIATIGFLTVLSSMEDTDQTMANAAYCERVTMYEADVNEGVRNIRGHRNFESRDCL